MKHQLILVASILLFYGCSNEQNTKTEAVIKDTEASAVDEEEVTEDDESTTEAEEIDFSSIEYDPLDLPTMDSGSGITILTVGQFHEEEVSSEANDMNWFGLFQEGTRSYLKKVELKLTKVYDPILDDEGEKSGWKISVENGEKCVLLIAGIDLKEADIPSFELEKKKVFPGDTLSLNSNSMAATLYATGLKKEISTDWYNVANYKMMLSIKENNKIITQNIVAKSSFNDDIIDVIWAGDIDGDNKIDLIIDTSRHYNSTTPTLFLSSKSKNEELVKCVASLESSGC